MRRRSRSWSGCRGSTVKQTALVGLGAAAGIMMTWLTRALALRAGIVNAPNPIVPQHTRPVAYLGGVAVALATGLPVPLLVVVGSGSIGELLAAPLGVLVGSIAFLGIGLVDDLQPLDPLPKLGLQALASGLAASLRVRPGVCELQVLDSLIGAAWILVLVNAVNLTDVCDGLVTGLAAIALLLLAQVGPQPTPIVWLGCGACLGFLVFNRPRASIFLGDAGTHFLGFLLAALTLDLVARGSRPGASFSALMIVSVFLFELVFLVVVRVRKGLPWWKGSPDHFSLRLQARGLSRLQTDVVAWMAALVQGAVGLFAGATLAESGMLAAAVTDLMALVGLGLVLARWEVPVHSRSPDGAVSGAHG